MSLPEIFIRRPVATTLLTLGVALAGWVAFFLLPVSPLPPIDIPTIMVQAQMPGASPETMANSVATPLERHLGQIADVTEITSQSSLGSTRVVLQFALNRDINGAARDVQAAINASRVDLPASLRSNPTYFKFNPASAPIMILALTSKTLTGGQIYDAAATVLQQKLSQVEGVGQVSVGGSSLPAVRVEMNPRALFRYGIGLEDVRAALAAANANAPKGAIEQGGRLFQIQTNDQARRAEQYRRLIIAYRNGAPVRLADVAEVTDGVEDLRNIGYFNGRQCISVLVMPQPGANIIQTVDRMKVALPQLRASLPRDVELAVALDRTTTIRASLRDVERTLVIAVLLVILVVFLFLRDARSTIIPSVVVPVCLIGTFAIMYLLGFSLDNMSLMALTVATGFVVDDAVVVMENIVRHIEAGMPRARAVLQGTREVSFTVLSMSLSLIAVFLPILLMGGLLGRLFHEFAVTLAVAILVSLVISLTTTPMMCMIFLRDPAERRQTAFLRGSERVFAAMNAFYARTLQGALRHPRLMLGLLLAAVCFNVYLFVIVPKGFFPQQDIGQLEGRVRADQSTSFQAMSKKLLAFVNIVKSDPAVENVIGFTGGGGPRGGQTNNGQLFVTLKPLSARKLSADEVIARLRPKGSQVPGANLFLQASQDIRAGGRSSDAQYQYTLQADELEQLRLWVPKLVAALRQAPELADISSDQQDRGLETDLQVDRQTAGRFGLTTSQIDNTLYDAYGQRQASTIYNPLNQYHVVMEVAPQYWQSPETLDQLYVSTSGGTVRGTQATNAVAGTFLSKSVKPTASAVAADTARNLSLNALANTTHGGTSTGAAVSTAAERLIPLSAFSHFGPGTTPLEVNHQGTSAAGTISFNLTAGHSLSDAQAALNRAMRQIGVPATVQGSFQGTARNFQSAVGNEPVMILAALVAVYIVLGILYESYVHPLTILSTLPSAGIGAILALLVCNSEFSIIALLGVILLIGVVKKNAIMMIDFALDAERTRGLSPLEAITEASLRRFRPILMTTMVAMLAAVPLAVGTGNGAEMRRPLGISIFGGLLVSQMLTLYTTPVVYLSLDRLRLRFARRRRGGGVPSGAGA